VPYKIKSCQPAHISRLFLKINAPLFTFQIWNLRQLKPSWALVASRKAEKLICYCLVGVKSAAIKWTLYMAAPLQKVSRSNNCSDKGAAQREINCCSPAADSHYCGARGASIRKNIRSHTPIFHNSDCVFSVTFITAGVSSGSEKTALRRRIMASRACIYVFACFSFHPIYLLHFSWRRRRSEATRRTFVDKPPCTPLRNRKKLLSLRRRKVAKKIWFSPSALLP
jgi:hypothetical protein